MSERQIVCEDLNLALDDLRRRHFRVDAIYPADEPHTAILSNGDTKIRLTSRPGAPPVPETLPPFAPEFVLTSAGSTAVAGRAGMAYRDLIPGRLGGRYVASHILIAEGGPTADWVHYHRIRLQMILVRRGWVRVVYEGEGEPIVMHEGDLVVQPPEIRHRVLESSAGLEVIEITAPAVHATFSDHGLDLPGGDAARNFAGQRFIHHVAAVAPWKDFRGGEAQETSVADATGLLAEARIVRPDTAGAIDFPAHEGELVFGFVLDGSAVLDFSGERPLEHSDAFVIPPRQKWRLTHASSDLRLLHVVTASLG